MESYPLRIKFTRHGDAEKALNTPLDKGVSVFRPSPLSSTIWMVVSGRNSEEAYGKTDKFLELHRKEIEHILVPNAANLKTKK